MCLSVSGYAQEQEHNHEQTEIETQTQSEPLPELGDSATQYLNAKQEKVIGQDFFRKLRANPDYVDDYELHDYLQKLSAHIGQYADLREMQLTFSLIRKNNINAFAVPGGYITFHTGLLMATENESEFASVAAHEIAHITQRHLARLIAKSEQNRIPALAAILGSILIGGQAGLAGVTATNAALLSNQLSYTRDFEREADAVGIKLLADSGYNPNAMSSFFGKLEKYALHNDNDTPEFLRTHPFSWTRVAESEARAAEYTAVEPPGNLEYYLAKARIRAWYFERQENPQLFFKDQMQSDNELERAAAAYGTAIHLMDEQKFADALDLIKPLTQKYPQQRWITILHSELDIAAGRTDAAIERYQSLQQRHPKDLLVTYHLAEAWLETGRPELAKKQLRYQIRRNPHDFTLYKLLALANVALHHLAEAHQAQAQHHAILGDYSRAIATLKLALGEAQNANQNDSQNENQSDAYLRSSIQARLTEFKYQLKLQQAIRDT